MKNNKKDLNYFQYSQNIFISILTISPFFFIYQVMRYFLYRDANYIKVNAAENIIVNFFKSYSITYVFDLVILLIGLILFIKFKRDYNFKIKLNYMFMIILEGLCFGFLLFYFIINPNTIYKTSLSIHAAEKFYLGIGAGIWEELFFRVLLLNVVIFFINLLFKAITKISVKQISFFILFVSIVFVSTLFALIHYPEHINNLSNLIMLSGFQEKLIGGIFLGYLYNYRGFGITCICHITFNFLIYINVIGNPT